MPTRFQSGYTANGFVTTAQGHEWGIADVPAKMMLDNFYEDVTCAKLNSANLTEESLRKIEGFTRGEFGEENYTGSTIPELQVLIPPIYQMSDGYAWADSDVQTAKLDKVTIGGPQYKKLPLAFSVKEMVYHARDELSAMGGTARITDLKTNLWKNYNFVDTYIQPATQAVATGSDSLFYKEVVPQMPICIDKSGDDQGLDFKEFSAAQGYFHGLNLKRVPKIAVMTPSHWQALAENTYNTDKFFQPVETAQAREKDPIGYRSMAHGISLAVESNHLPFYETGNRDYASGRSDVVVTAVDLDNTAGPQLTLTRAHFDSPTTGTLFKKGERIEIEGIKIKSPTLGSNDGPIKARGYKATFLIKSDVSRTSSGNYVVTLDTTEPLATTSYGGIRHFYTRAPAANDKVKFVGQKSSSHPVTIVVAKGSTVVLNPSFPVKNTITYQGMRVISPNGQMGFVIHETDQFNDMGKRTILRLIQYQKVVREFFCLVMIDKPI